MERKNYQAKPIRRLALGLATRAENAFINALTAGTSDQRSLRWIQSTRHVSTEAKLLLHYNQPHAASCTRHAQLAVQS